MISGHQKEVAAIQTACGMIDVIEEPEKIRHCLSHSEPVPRQESLERTLRLCCSGLEIVSDAAREVFTKEIVVENSKYLSIAEELLRLNAPWKVIVMTRDPRGIAASNKEAGKRKGVPRPVKDKIELFLSFSRRVAKMIRDERVLLVRYEDICRNTVGALEHTCGFLNVAFEARMMEFKTHKGHLLMGNRMIHDRNQEVREDLRWHELLSTEEKRLFIRNDLIEAYRYIGYNLETES